MVWAFEFSERLNFVPLGAAAQVEAHFKTAQLPTQLSDIPALHHVGVEELVDKMMQDKKVQRGTLVFILARSIGEAFVCRDVSLEQLTDFLREKVLTA